MSATTHEKLKITSPIGVTAEFVRGELVFFYKACSPVCASVPTRYNDKIIGLSLVGTVTKTENETVRLELDIDKGAPHGSHPYAWAPAEALSGGDPALLMLQGLVFANNKAYISEKGFGSVTRYAENFESMQPIPYMYNWTSNERVTYDFLKKPMISAITYK